MSNSPCVPPARQRARLAYAVSMVAALLILVAQGADIAAHYRLQLSQRHDELVTQLAGVAASSPWRFLALLATFALAAALHFAMFWVATFLYRATCAQLRPQWQDRIVPHLLWLAAATVVLVLWNDRLFPRSLVFPNSDVIARQTASPIVFWSLNLLFATAACIAITALVKTRARRWMMLAPVLLLAAWAPTWPTPNRVGTDQRSTQPDIILIGLDSVRPEYLRPYGYPDSALTPALNALSSQMVLFDDTVTPLARTFVAYMSVLSGQYPVRHGARFNLYPRSEFPRNATLAHRLRNAGYFTAYTTDETRFANIDRSFGFDEVATPPTGVSDFVVGAVLDSLATNLLSLTPPGRLLLPNLHGNRAVARMYDPEDHTNRVERLVAGFPEDKPALLVAHYCLAHWPFSWRMLDTTSVHTAPAHGRYAGTPEKYLRALNATDAQVARLLASLRRAGRLENAIVVMFSDHGESLSLKRDLLEPMSEGVVDGNMFSGHGAFALANSQYQVLLGIQRFRRGKPVWTPHRADAPASLVDIAPSVLSMADIAFKASDFDGTSLATVASGERSLPTNRPRFVESGLSGTAVETTKIDEAAIASELSHLYRVTDDLRLEVAKHHLPHRLAIKQRGVYAGGYGLATLPRPSTQADSKDCWQLADFRRQTLRCVDSPTKDRVAAPLQQLVCTHFRRDSGFIEKWCTDTATPPIRAAAPDGLASSSANEKPALKLRALPKTEPSGALH